MRAIETIIRKAAGVLAVVGCVAIIGMMGLIVADVAMKYLLNDPIDGTTAVVAAYFMVALVFLPLAYVTFTSGHLFVELFTQALSARQLRPFNMLSGLLTLTYLGFLIIFTFAEAVRRTAEGEAWETAADLMDVWPSRWLLPIGLAVMVAAIVLQMRRQWRDRDGAAGSAEADQP